MVEPSKEQERLTLQDTLLAQKKLLDLVNSKIENVNEPWLKPSEKSNYFDLLSYAMLSQGALSHKAIRIKAYNRIFEPASDVHHFGLILMDIDTARVTLKLEKKYEFDLIFLWKTFRWYLTLIISHAQAEALKKSKEIIKGEQQSQSFTYDSDDNL